MINFRIRSFITYCIALPAILISSACEDSRPPPIPADSDDPGTVARQAVADYLSLPLADITLVSLEAREFNDSSLDCPEPGMAYQQVITPGHRAVVEARGRRFDVRISGSHGKLCRHTRRAGQRKDQARQTPRESAVASLVALAREDLADALGIAPEEIRQLDIRAYDGENPPPGCRPRCPKSAETCGYVIGLVHDGRRFDFHAVDGKAAPCPPISRF